MKGAVIAGVGSGVGKTAVATGLMRRLSGRHRVQGYKVGPDFIDPMYHTAATGRPSRNLDSFMMRPDTIRNLVGHSSIGADICIVEGVRGLFEGASGTSDAGSTAEIAKLLGLPVILVVNARSLTRSAAAIVNGFAAFDPDIEIAGVILNNISGKQHETKIADAMDRYSSIKVLGTVRRDLSRTVTENSKGLVGPDDATLAAMTGLTEDLDLDAVMEAMRDVPIMPSSSPFTERPSQGVRAAVASDDSFCFRYSDNIECMRASGIDIKMFRPTEGDMLPDADIYYLGGGYPEDHLRDLSGNRDFIEGIRNASSEGKAVLGECGGMLTLCNGISVGGERHEMAGVFDAEAVVTGERHGPSYVIGEGTDENPFFRGATVRAHEFHHYDLTLKGSHGAGYILSRGTGMGGGKDGLVSRNTVGTLMHQHALSVDDWCGRILSAL